MIWIFFIEKINPDNKNQYLYDGKWKDMKTVEETIPLKNNRDTTVIVRLTHHGPNYYRCSQHFKIRICSPIYGHGTGNWLTKEVDGLFGLATSKDWG